MDIRVVRQAVAGRLSTGALTVRAEAVPGKLVRVASSLSGIVLEAAANLHPAYFALVMATGIISIASNFLGMSFIALPLFWIAIISFVWLCLLTLLRIIFYPGRFLADLFDHGRGPGFFTIVAGTGIVGNQLILVMHDYRTAVIIWLLAVILYLALTYSIFTCLIIKNDKPSIAEGINGGWLTAVVATQSIAALSGLLATYFEVYSSQVFFLSLAMWLVGGMLYIWIISLIFYRYFFFKFSPQDLAPPYWINMGAVAISTLSGTILIGHAQSSPFLQDVLPFLKGFTLLFWATGTWWIPMLVILGIWRHLYKKMPFTYNPLYWGAVFPLGMYTAATFRLANVTGLQFLAGIPEYFIFIAMAAWLVTSIGLAKAVFKKVVAGFHAG